ncbi:glucans biosynthesis glucosyltransferase MdoH [Hyphomonas sp.]|uniref:glucans biosynthesis glucosyltransferase MdoH n=1 Tax=Hyphomonas sp. TaxID=87 RepID=UPI0025BAB169|nr:glucans biosynthesis glucosyltransferase MdoH [Hyphomonas sp.]
MTDFRARPIEFPVSMPDQAFAAPAADRDRYRPKSLMWRKLFVFGSALLLTGWATHEMYQVLKVSGLTVFEWALLVVFTLNISWVCFAFVNALAGLASALHTASRPEVKINVSRVASARTVIAFPIYNEDVDQIFATVLSTAQSLSNAPGHFECFVLSDTTDADIALREEAAFERVQALRPQDVKIHYRRRTINLHRKSGNIRDFVTRWGGRYDYMVVYDADSYMERDAILRLVDAMQAAPKAGLIQTIPQLVGVETLFGRYQQFAAALYGPVLGHGIAWWSQKEGNFWGHNAIIRIRALAEAAGLPVIPGRAPFGGTIMSHDFVEAAMLRRAGWNVEVRPEIGGSFEQGPPTIIDLVVRDRRWCQGNMQHMAVLLKARGLTFTSRFHLITGIFSYLSSPLWLLFICIGMVLSLQNSFLVPDYFGEGATLFPSWPVIDSERALNLFMATMVILFTPKICGLIYGLSNRAWRKGVGAWRTILGTLTETALSVLTAPMLMVTQTSAVVSVLSGQDSGWAPQRRGDDGYSFATTFRHNLPATALGVVLTVSAVVISPIHAAWLAPATLGLILSAPVSYFTAKSRAGRKAKEMGLLATPHDGTPPASSTASIAAREEFGRLRPHTLQSLLQEPHDIHRRSYMVDPYWPVAHGDVHVPLAVARARAEKAASIPEFVSLLKPNEKMALLNSCKDMRGLSFRFLSVRTSEKRGWPAAFASGAYRTASRPVRTPRVKGDPA